MTDFDLAGLVSARICHDLASPVGAVVNGADLIDQLDLHDAGDALTLVAQSARRAAALLKFHRLAFGTSGDANARTSHTELRSRAEQAVAGARITLEWPAQDSADIAVPVARLGALMLLAARATLGRGGVLRVTPSLDRDLPLTVQATGPQAGFNGAQLGWLRGDAGEPPQPRQVEFVLIGPAASRAGARIELSEDPDSVTMRAIAA